MMHNEEKTLVHLSRNFNLRSGGYIPRARRTWRTLLFLPMLCVVPSFGFAQDVSISITEEIDSLHAQLLRAPGNRSLQRKLVDAYILTFNPELALLEIVDAGKAADAKVKGLTQMSLEQVHPALRSLQQAYLESPSDETLLLIALLDYGRGDTRRGASLLRRVQSRDPHLSVEMLKLYERFYINDRRQIASAALLALRDFDPVSYEAYFPRPSVAILSPADGYTTEAIQTSVIAEVRHTRPVQRIELQQKPVYDRAGEKIVSPNEEFRQTVSQLVQLSEGRNVVVVEATDVFKNKGSDTIVVNGLNFSRPAGWISSAADSLKRMFQYFCNYVPDSVLLAEKLSSYRALIISGQRSGDSSAMDEKGLVLYELLTNPISGIVQPSNVKLLLKDRVKGRNISLIVKDWLLKGATFQSVSIVYVGGEWRFSGQRWDLVDYDGDTVDMKPLLEELRVVATAGVVLLIDGVAERDAFVQNVQLLAKISAVPFQAMILPKTGDWVPHVLTAMSAAGSRKSDQGPSFLSTQHLEGMIPGSLALSLSGQPIKIAQIPMKVIYARHQELLLRVQRKLVAEKAPAATKTKILDFCGDWRRYHEMARFLSNTLTLGDFVIRVDEYRSRTNDGLR